LGPPSRAPLFGGSYNEKFAAAKTSSPRTLAPLFGGSYNEKFAAAKTSSPRTLPF